MGEPGRGEWAGGTANNKVQTKFNLDQVQKCWLGCWPAALEMGFLTGRAEDEKKDCRELGRGDQQGVRQARANAGMPNASQTVSLGLNGGCDRLTG